MTDQIPTTVSFWRSNGKWLLGAAAIATGLGFVLMQVNPETIAAFREQTARADTKTEIYRCINKLAHQSGTAADALGCIK